ncbi:MAG: hypothetical protein HY366_02935 [Candidatus Aenigmarchaeota archaeon]|nr:hypothetical protein [Candidatus Aenigmarchaeota archaeon]
MAKPLMTKKFEITSELGFPTNVYFDMLGWLDKNKYDFKKTNDWLYINPKTAQHAEVAQRRQAIEQRLAQVMINIGDLRRDVELLKHDLRKFESALEHHKKNDLDVLKSDYIDFIDQQTPNSMLKLAQAGRFPSIVVDFFRIKSERDIEDLKISKSEKSLLKIKWKLFQQWRSTFAQGVEDRVRVLREEINSRQASLDNYKDSIRPYLEAIHKIRTSEEHPTDVFSDPTLIEGFLTSVAGVDLAAWRGAKLPGKQMYPDRREYHEGREVEKFDYYVYFDIKIKRRQVIIKGKEIEDMLVTIEGHLKSWQEIEAKKKEIKAMEDAILRSLEEFRGTRELAQPSEKSRREESTLEKLKKTLSASAQYVVPKVGEPESIMKRVVKEQVIELYDAIKESAGALKLQRMPTEGR